MNFLRWTERVVRAAMLVLVAGACIDQGVLFEPGTDSADDAPRLRLDQASYTLYAGDQVSVRVQGWEPGLDGQAEILVLDIERTVVWRSPQVQVSDTVVSIPVDGFPPALYADDELVLTASMELDAGRIYATDDTSAVVAREDAAVRPVRFFRGDVVALTGGSPLSFALDAAGGRLFFAAGERAQIGVIDLALGRELRSLDVPTGPIALRFFRGSLGALVADGTELVVFDGQADIVRHRVLLPTLFLEGQTRRAGADGSVDVDTLSAAVRPYGVGLAWACGDSECSSSVALSSSQVIGEGTDASGVMRTIFPGGNGPAPLVLPEFQAGVLPADSVASRIRVWAADHTGSDSLVVDYDDRALCAIVGLGSSAFDVMPGGDVLYVAAPGDPPCGDGTRLMRVDYATSASPRLNALARRNLLGEDRIDAVTELRVSPDGEFVLARSDDRVHLLDADLRLRATIPVSAPTAIAWVESGVESSGFFAIAAADGVALYDTERRVVVARFPLGPTRDALLAVWRSGDELVAVAAPRGRDGVVAARVPAP
jgi:hypothetical protein